MDPTAPPRILAHLRRLAYRWAPFAVLWRRERRRRIDAVRTLTGQLEAVETHYRLACEQRDRALDEARGWVAGDAAWLRDRGMVGPA